MKTAGGRPIRLRSVSVEDWCLFREIRLQALAEAPYAFSTRLSEWQGAGDTEERWRNRLQNVPLNVIAYYDGAAAGMVSAYEWDTNVETVELISMWVAPFARGRGIGDALIDHVREWAARRHAARVVLAVRDANETAIALYERNGFQDEGAVVADSPAAPAERRMVLTIP